MITTKNIPRNVLKSVPIPIRRGDKCPAPRIFRTANGQVWKVVYTDNGGIASLEAIG